ncbi:MAG: TldD/PmbA family protein [Leptolyngbyaceae cyanobacterium SM1_1_3]|nr:TldD/PmbA family protein [Leptolyngbyaceae cyanobacterium SM1_1_3]NJN03312.1 TldD/PmbA family protein [Leptolyngbyaceae cyanobacterium RM1_1_2]
MIEALSQCLDALSLPADWVGIRAVKESINHRSMRDQMPQRNSRALDWGAMVEVIAQGQSGYAATNVLSPEGLRQAAEAAYQQAIAASHRGLYSVSPALRPAITGRYQSAQQKPFDALSPADINDVLARICQQLQVSDQITQTNATAIASETETWFVSSSGAEIYQQFFLVETHFGVTAQDAGIVQQRSDNGSLARCYQGGWEVFLGADLWQRVDRVAQQAIELLSAADCPDVTTTLVLAPDQMMLQIHESVGHPLELDRILGDERNYAGGSFVSSEDFGDLAYGSPLMNVTFDPTVAGELASYSFDDTGAPATREYLIRAGILERGLGSLESQMRLGVPGVACARASTWNRPAVDRMANINLEPGDYTFEDLIGNIEHGVYMQANRSWSIDDQRYKFQFGCEYAQLIEQGQLTKTLRNPNYRATTPQFWQSLMAVGDRSTWQVYGTPFCGKGEPNQAIRVGHGAPVCAFEAVEIFGGAS